MPKLGKEHQARVRKADPPAEGSGFTVIDDGLYACTLDAVDVLPPKSPSDPESFGQWQCRYKVVEDITEDGTGDQHKGATLMDWLSLSDKDYPVQLMAEFFAAFGKTPADDTDSFLGDECVLDVGHEVARFGKRKGQTVNVILRKMDKDFGVDPPEGDPVAPEEGEEPF